MPSPPGQPDRETPARNPLVRLLARETASTSFIPSVDGLRFVAIVSVLLYHAATYVGTKLYGLPTGSHMPRELCDNAFFRFGSLGFFGVQLFFAISGFILAVPFARSALVTTDRRVSLRQYFLRRVTRLEPPYVFNLLVLAALLVAVKHEPSFRRCVTCWRRSFTATTTCTARGAPSTVLRGRWRSRCSSTFWHPFCRWCSISAPRRCAGRC